jgi:hypothetical protein
VTRDWRLEIGDWRLEIGNGDWKIGVGELNFISNFRFEKLDFWNIQISDLRKA